MYSSEERNSFFDNIIEKLEASKLVEGIIQLGSGVVGYTDEHSDIDLMIATSEIKDAEVTKRFAYQTFNDFNSLYIKEKQFSEEIFLIIAIMENHLEFNVSIVPRDLLTVRSPLWKVITDKTGLVTEKMNVENKKFKDNPEKYRLGFDISFEFVYCFLSFEKELKRNNLIYALKMLEQMRDYTLTVQALNEKKKLHQLKAYNTLEPSFIKAYLSTYPNKITREKLEASARQLRELFTDTINQNSTLSMENALENLLEQTTV
ncbi:aminoglycoside 6-adenylyltransferase [Pontibacillus salipaludis]|uniref:Polymerase nucleotidyl transferase domain-containing protein n=1 Tax=Pontibacillus salipaludis TaxID=1697394 RepID=A0ABQ1QF13_9BACI|nr:aminoglycoside 6-adenylyltransferase [Pontibacillus salipaludis]GGD25507.1 hypothetical protein GCM10011389_36420 [Pontibacillus salipaludis]